MNEIDNEFRPLSEEERRVIQRLLEQPFPGRDEMLRQLEGAQVRFQPDCLDHACGSLEIRVESDVVIPDSSSLTQAPYEGLYTDESGEPVQIALFHKQGKLCELEFIVYSMQPRGRFPKPEEMSVYKANAY
jgi:hypothetical protein